MLRFMQQHRSRAQFDFYLKSLFRKELDFAQTRIEYLHELAHKHNAATLDELRAVLRLFDIL